MNISSVVLRAHPDRMPAIRAELEKRPGHEVHAEHDDGRLALTLEGDNATTAADAYVALHDLPGVLSVSLIYQYSDDDTATADAGVETIAN